MATVTFEHVFKKFGDFNAVNDLNLEIGDGEFMVLVGPSGCGKTTSLRMIAGLEEITEGTLRIGDRVVNDVAPKDRDIAMVFQSYALYPHMSVRENLAFGLKLRKVPKAEIERRVKEAADTIQLGSLLDRKPKELSGGQRQRVALGRAIVREPAVFLMDEPLSNLDAKLRVQTRAEIARLHQRLKTTIVYVTHDQVEAMTMGSAHRGHERRHPPAGRHAAGPVRHADQPVRRRVHRQPVDELRGRHRERLGRGRPPRGRTGLGHPAAGPDPGRDRHRQPASAGRRLPARAPRHRRGRSGRRLVPGSRGRRRVPRQRGTAARQRRRQGHRGDRRFRASGPAGRHRRPGRAAREAAPVRRRDRRGDDRGRRWPERRPDRRGHTCIWIGPERRHSPGPISSSASSTRRSSTRVAT